MMDIKSLSKEELREFIVSNFNEKSFRADQIYNWVHAKHVDFFDDMSNISCRFAEMLSEKSYINSISIEKELISSIDGTRKFLFKLSDGNIIESVMMKYEFGNSVCISSQVGCRMGCRFCASTIGGLIRNLSPSEMLDQIYKITSHTGEKISHIVVMGSGEPFDNFENLIKFIEIVSSEDGINISRRNITVSTCGIVPQIYRLADMNSKVTLAISLHAPNDELRRKIMPIAEKYCIDDIIKACKYYFDKTGRRVTFEYSLISGVNDSLGEAKELAEKLRPLNTHVNLIPVNPVEERNFRSSNREKVNSFLDFLVSKGVNATVRREMGRDISGACGQLRIHHIKDGKANESSNAY